MMLVAGGKASPSGDKGEKTTKAWRKVILKGIRKASKRYGGRTKVGKQTTGVRKLGESQKRGWHKNAIQGGGESGGI